MVCNTSKRVSGAPGIVIDSGAPYKKMTRFKWVAALALIVLGCSWGAYRQHKIYRELRGFVESFTAQSQFIEAMRNLALKGAPPSAMAQSLRNIVNHTNFGWATEFRRSGSPAAKAFQSAPQSTQYYVTNLEAMVERVKDAAVRDLIKALRDRTGQDLGDDPAIWIDKYAGDNSAMAVWGVSAQADPTTYLAAINPTPGSLGTGWQSHVEFLIDPTGEPSEILGSDQFSADTLTSWRRSSKDTNYTLSGWVRARFDSASAHATNRYYLEIDRFRNKAVLTNQFAQMLVARAANPQRTFPRDIGEAAIVEHEKGAPTLWFRRGFFLVRVSSFGATPAGETGGSMRDLANTVDRNIINAEKRATDRRG